MSVLTVIEDAIESIEQAVEELPRVSAVKIGLDIRAGSVYVDEDGGCIIADNNSTRTLDYYGGFEYVDEDAITTIGRFKVYSDENSRVEKALEYYNQMNGAA